MPMMVAWDKDGQVVATCSFMARMEDGEVVGHYDFDAAELGGHSLRDLWVVPRAVGSGAWPEQLGVQAQAFKVETRPGPKGGTHKVVALVHKDSGHRRERAPIHAEVDRRVGAARAQEALTGTYGPPNITDLVGGYGDNRGLALDEHGRDMPKVVGRPAPDIPYVRTRPGDR